MPPISELSDESIPTSAHALQIRKEAKALQKQQTDKAFRQNLIVWLTVGALGITSTVIGYILGHVVALRRRRDNRDQSGSSSEEEEGVSNTTLENDVLAIEVAEFGRRRKRNIERNEIQEIEDLLSSEEFLRFLEEHE